MLRDGEGAFLDDITTEQLGRELGCRVEVLPTDGRRLLPRPFDRTQPQQASGRRDFRPAQA